MPDPSPAKPKLCVICGQDCSTRPRQKDAEGRYACTACVEKQKSRPRPAKPPPLLDEDDALVALDDEPARVAAASCPGCRAPMPGGAVVCLSCGYNMQTGRSLATAVAAPARERRARSIHVSPFTFGFLCVAGVGLFAAAGYYEPLAAAAFAIVVLIMMLVATIGFIVCAFADGDSGWGIVGIVGIFLPFVGLAMLYYIFAVSERGYLKGLYIASLLGLFLVYMLAARMDA